MKRGLDKDSFAFDGPSNIVEDLIQFTLILSDTCVFPQEGQISLGKLCVSELLVDVVDEFGVLDEISGLQPVFIFQGLELL